ncbi:MAG: hypothetical protein II797_05690 [Clostridia bacterium]|nr:hypothetical protein [Clostridia bacterium]
MKLKQIVSLLLASLLLLSLAGCGQEDTPSGMKLASDPAIVDFKLYVPESWTVDLQTGAVSAYCSKADPSSVNVMIWDAPQTDFSPNDWWETGKKDLEDLYSDFSLLSTAETTLGGISATRFDWTGKLSGNTYRFLQVTAVRRGLVYVFTFGTLVAVTDSEGNVTKSTRYEDHLDEVSKILECFSFT